MKVRELVQPSPTCDTRAHLATSTSVDAVDAPSTPIDVDLRSAATRMRRRRTSTLLVLERDEFVGVVTIEDLLRGALASGDQQLCSDLSAQMRYPATDTPRTDQ